MAGLDPSIILSGKPPEQIDLGNVLANVMQLKKQNAELQAQQQTIQQQNALKQALTAPDAVDPKTGLPTTNTLAKVMSIDPTKGIALADQLGQAEQRQATAEHTKSETQTAQRKLYTQQVGDALSVYDGELASGDVPPAIAERNMRASLVDQIDGMSISQPDKDRLKKVAAEAPLPALRTYAMSDQLKEETEKLKAERTPMVMGGKPVLLDKTGKVYDPQTGKETSVTGPIEKPEAAGEEKRLAQQARAEDARIHHEDVMEGLAEKRLEQAEHERQPNLSPQAVDLVADQVLAGDKSALANLGRGRQGAEDLAAIRNRVAEKATAKGLKGTDLANINAAFGGEQAAARTMAVQERKLGAVEAAADNAAKLYTDAYKGLGPVSDLKPLNAFIQTGEAQVSDPKLKRAMVAAQGLATEYASAMNRGGAPHVDDMKYARNLIAKAIQEGPEANKAMVDQIRAEIQGVRRANERVTSETTGGYSTEASAPGAPKSETKRLKYNPATGTLDSVGG